MLAAAATAVPVRSQQEMELAAFEKGRMQGEMEAARRLEAERVHQKQMLPAGNELAAPINMNVLRPDVVEINRLTWLQRAAFVLGELSLWAFVILTITWLDRFRGDVSWTSGNDGGNVSFWNTHYLVNALGIFFLANAITNYRVAPLNMHPWLNRAWYVFLMSAAVVCFSMALASMVRATPEDEVWSVGQWCFCFAYALFALHALYSIVSTLLEPLHHRNVKGQYGQWSETGTHLETPEQRRDHSAYNHQARTVYTPAPVHVHTHLPHHHGATGTGATTATTTTTGGAATVPTAPANAPRWAENPNTHSEDYWLLPRAKWACVAFFALGAAILMDLAGAQNLLAAGNANWAQAPNNGDGDAVPIGERSREADVIGAMGLMLLSTLIFMTYVAMPPRTSLVKNGILVDPAANNLDRRTSISHNAETQLGQPQQHVV